MFIVYFKRFLLDAKNRNVQKRILLDRLISKNLSHYSVIIRLEKYGFRLIILDLCKALIGKSREKYLMINCDYSNSSLTVDTFQASLDKRMLA